MNRISDFHFENIFRKDDYTKKKKLHQQKAKIVMKGRQIGGWKPKRVVKEHSIIPQDNMGPLETPLMRRKTLARPSFHPGMINVRNLMTPFSMRNAVNFEVTTTQCE